MNLSSLSAHSGSSITNRVGIAPHGNGGRVKSRVADARMSTDRRIVIITLTMTSTSMQTVSSARTLYFLGFNIIHLRSRLNSRLGLLTPQPVWHP